MFYKDTLMWKEISETPKIFARIKQANNTIMQKLVTEIKASKATNFVAAARGTSDHALIYFKYVLESNSRYTVGLSAPSVITLYNGKIDYSDSIVIGCSQSGKAADVLEVLKRGNKQGAITIAVTNDENSPMAKEAKYHLFCAAEEEKSVAATKTFSAELFNLLWLAAEISDNQTLLKDIDGLGNSVDAVFPVIDNITTQFADKFNWMKSGFVLSRGITYSIALEATLKLQETCYIQMKGYAGSDFYHGPMAMVNEQTPVFIYCAKNTASKETADLLYADQKKCIDKMLELTAPVIVVTNDKKIAEDYKSANVAYFDFSFGEEITMFAFALFAQMLACKISCSIGNNPDSPRALNKVTITK